MELYIYRQGKSPTVKLEREYQRGPGGR